MKRQRFVRKRPCSHFVRIALALLSALFYSTGPGRFVYDNVVVKTEKVQVAIATSIASTVVPSPPSTIETKSCKPNSQLPKGWCIDDDGTPRYTGTVSSNNHTSSVEVIQRYNHAGFEQCLANKTIVFIGDSRVRYQLMNLAGFLKKSTFMKCQDYNKVLTSNQSYTSPDDDCYLINREFQLGSEMKGNDWTSYYKESTKMIESNNVNGKQYSMCDCYRKHPFSDKTTYENRFIKRQTAYGEINLMYLQNFVDLIRMNKDFPPYSSFWSDKRCQPGECSDERRSNIFSGNTNETLWEILPKLNATHTFVSSGWGPRFVQTADISCILESFHEHHPNIETYLISHPATQNAKYDKATWFDGDRLKCNVNSLDRQSMSTNVPEKWYSDRMHVLSILNEEFNHRFIETLCPITE